MAVVGVKLCGESNGLTLHALSIRRQALSHVNGLATHKQGPEGVQAFLSFPLNKIWGSHSSDDAWVCRVCFPATSVSLSEYIRRRFARVGKASMAKRLGSLA